VGCNANAGLALNASTSNDCPVSGRDVNCVPMAISDLATRFDPILEDIATRSQVTDSYLDRNLYRLYVATLWTNVVLDPHDAGVNPEDLEDLHDLVNERITDVLGSDDAIRACFEFINSKAGERAMQEARLTQNHKDLLLYFSSMILDPDGHRRWMETISENSTR